MQSFDWDARLTCSFRVCCGLQLQIPDWVDIVKTATFKELPPQDKDWYYIRAGAATSHKRISMTGAAWGPRSGVATCRSSAAAQDPQQHRVQVAVSPCSAAGAASWQGTGRSARQHLQQEPQPSCLSRHSTRVVAAACAGLQQLQAGAVYPHQESIWATQVKCFLDKADLLPAAPQQLLSP
jgi:hypothetical protein